MYSQLTDVLKWVKEDTLLQLATVNPEATISDAEVTGPVHEAIAAADAEIDMYLLGRWPGLRDYSPAPDAIRTLSARMAVYYLFLHYEGGVPEDRKDDHKECIRKLEKAAEGKLSLGIDTSGTLASEGENQYRSDSLDTDDDLDDYDRRQYTQDKLDKL